MPELQPNLSSAREFLPEGLQYPIAQGLQDRGFLRFGDFTLKDGSWSPYYINLRGIGSFDYRSPLGTETQAAIRDDIVTGYSKMVEALDSDHILGIPEAGFTSAGMVGYCGVNSVLQMRVKSKLHGQPVSIEGDFYEGESVTLIDDVVTSGKSKFEAAEKLELNGLVTGGFVVLVDREQGGVQEVEQAGHLIITGMTVSSIVRMLRASGRLPHKEAEIITAYTKGEISSRPT